MKRVAIFVSRYDHCLYDLLLRHRAEELACEIPLIVSNHPDHESLAEQFGCAYRVFPISPRPSAPSRRAARSSCSRPSASTWSCSPATCRCSRRTFLERWNRPVINIHHSFLPAFSGGRPYQQAAERGVKLVGATAHYATRDLDEGPIIEQDVIRTSHRDSLDDLVRKGRDVEKSVLSRAVRWHLEDRVLVYGNKTVVFA